MKFKIIGLVIFFLGLLAFHMNSTLGFLFLLFGGNAPDPTQMEKGMMLLLPGFYLPVGAILMVLSGLFYRKIKKEGAK